MPLDASATPTTATNRATYLANSRLRVFVPDEIALGAASAAGAVASVRPSGVSGWREVLISRRFSKKAGICLLPQCGRIIQGKAETAAAHDPAAAGNTDQLRLRAG